MNLGGGYYFLAYSGGKDSSVVLELARRAEVRYEAHYNVTTVDPPELVRFIREYTPEVIFDKPKLSMRELIIKNGMPPTRLARYCCSELKEPNGAGHVTLTGTRWAESPRRKEAHGVATIIGKKDGIEAEYRRTKQGGIVMNTDNDESRRAVELCYRTHKTMVNPIIDWTDEDVWEFIRREKIPYCKLYDEGWKRIGCIGCPMGTVKQRKKQFERWPGMYRMYIRTFDDMLEARRAAGKDTRWKSGRDVMDWWLREAHRDTHIDGQVEMEMET